MIQAGQQSTFPKMLFIQTRLRLERLVEEGLRLGKESVRPGYEEPISLGNGLKKDEPDSTDTARPRPRSLSHSSSILQELKRQSGMSSNLIALWPIRSIATMSHVCSSSIEKPQTSCLIVRTYFGFFYSGVFFDDIGDEETDDSQDVAVTAVESQGQEDEG